MFVSPAPGILISAKAQNQMTALFASALALMMPTMLLSGFQPSKKMRTVLFLVQKEFRQNFFTVPGYGLTVNALAVWSYRKRV